MEPRFNLRDRQQAHGHRRGVRIDAGFALKTLTGAGPDWLLGTTALGELLS